MNISDLVGALIALITVSLCTIKLYDLYKYIDENSEDQTDENSKR